MKEFVLIVCCLAGNLSLLAQSHVYSPLPDSNATWVYYQETYSAGQLVFTELVNYYLGEDTVNNGYVYHKVYKYSNNNYKEYIGAYRNVEDSMRVYALSEFPFENGLLIYDFNHEVGDTFFIPSELQFGPITVIDKDSIFINNNYFHYLHIQDLDNGYYLNDLWIEGVGTTKELLRSLYYSEFTSSQLLCASYNHDLYYNNPVFINPDTTCLDLMLALKEKFSDFNYRIYPNPSNDYINIQINSDAINISLEIYDLFGRLIRKEFTNEKIINISELPRGTYIIYLQSSKINYRTKIIKI
jgi:hypothetical protein